MRHFLFFYLLAAMAFLLTACSMQSPEADLSAADANTESVSNYATQSGVSKEPDELPAKEEENKGENPETDAQEPVPDGTENPVSTDVPSTETQPKNRSLRQRLKLPWQKNHRSKNLLRCRR